MSNLRLELQEWRGSGQTDPGHVRHVVLTTAPALFELPCGDPYCRDGGHDLTRAIMAELRAGTGRFSERDVCTGWTGGTSCGRELRLVALATYG